MATETATRIPWVDVVKEAELEKITTAQCDRDFSGACVALRRDFIACGLYDGEFNDVAEDALALAEQIRKHGLDERCRKLETHNADRSIRICARLLVDLLETHDVEAAAAAMKGIDDPNALADGFTLSRPGCFLEQTCSSPCLVCRSLILGQTANRSTASPTTPTNLEIC